LSPTPSPSSPMRQSNRSWSLSSQRRSPPMHPLPPLPPLLLLLPLVLFLTLFCFCPRPLLLLLPLLLFLPLSPSPLPAANPPPINLRGTHCRLTNPALAHHLPLDLFCESHRHCTSADLALHRLGNKVE
jgi:hypothetical protein